MSKLEQFEIKKYWQIFSGILKQNNTPKDTRLSYDLVKPILFNSKLDSSILNKIWNLSDIDDDDCLDFEEFVICMRLLFDMVNKSIDIIPDQLPEWLVPGSKVDLLKKKLSNQNDSQLSLKEHAPVSEKRSNITSKNDYESSNIIKEEKKDTPFGDDSVEEHSIDLDIPEQQTEVKDYVEEKEELPKQPVEWYMAPTEKSLYEAVYSTSKLNLDKTISFDSIYEALKSKVLITNLNKITELDVSKIWHLLNPSNLASINKYPALYLIHVVKQMNDNGCEVPISIPRSLAQTFKQNEIDGDLTSSNNNINRTQIYSTPVQKNFKKINEGTDFSSIEGKDWEKIRLKQELEQLDQQYENISKETENILKKSHLDIVREQFQELLSYKQNLLIHGQSSAANLSSFKDDLEIVEEQVSSLEGYLQQRKQFLAELQNEL
ncbi:hypothetical protein QEN19_004337 [Hanseniaspora menglaensis]